MALFMDRQFEAITELVEANIHAIDMHPDILVIWAYLKSKDGEKNDAKDYWEIATNRGFDLANKRWVSQLPKDLKDDLENTLKTISDLH